MYHPSRGGVRGGRDRSTNCLSQRLKFLEYHSNSPIPVRFEFLEFSSRTLVVNCMHYINPEFSWDDVKVDKHRENYLGHSLKAPVGRWQKGKDLHWYSRDKKSESSNSDALKEEIRRIKEEEEQAMREALGLAPKRATKVLGNRLDKHEFSELVKRSSTAEDLGAGHAEAAQVHGLGFSRGHRPASESDLPSNLKSVGVEMVVSQPTLSSRNDEESDYQSSEKKRKREENREKHGGKERNREKREGRHKQHSRDSDDHSKHKKDKGKRRHDSY